MKKASLSLSMNAIVILILAITLLGLGLSFMRGLFKQMETKTTAVVEAQELANPPTRDMPITTAPGSITLRSTEKGKILLAFMNIEAGDRYCQLDMLDSAGAKILQDGSDILIYNDDVITVGKDNTLTWTISVDASKGSTGTQIVSAKMCCDEDSG